MADSDALRARRRRRHRAGDHALCSVSRCDYLRAEARAAVEVAEELAAVSTGSLAAEVEGIVAACSYDPADPRRAMGALAYRVAESIDRAYPDPPAGVLVTGLHSLLRDLADRPETPADLVDWLRLRHHQRRAAVFMGIAQGSA